MTPHQVQLVQNTMRRVLPVAEPIAALTFNRLFTLDSTLRALFRGDMEMQGKKLMAMLILVAHQLDRPEEFLPAVRQLGRRHAGYGVQPEDYRQVGQALLWAMAEELGETFAPELVEAWTAFYDMLAAVMQEAAQEVASRNGLSYQSKPVDR